ncbi:hypothetical protein SAMN02745136_00458 [Anaerocolumna jejuensis DSM 15929]|uniref:Uncharacterized protein n=1 Tax=Anaerocolumna jejuensis DSM 15929 TaxID=1121322 RepID=A0A1M6KHY0_9FIRM|nr:hypothetical protein [Anaerocolumna jejuensis]SHJ58510.1 hypothetical protein SAMN02745136_00458 [Anaerocolumna jejuensis DSM 15929]
MAESKTISEIFEDAIPLMDLIRDRVIKQYEDEEERGYVEFEVIL